MSTASIYSNYLWANQLFGINQTGAAAAPAAAASTGVTANPASSGGALFTNLLNALTQTAGSSVPPGASANPGAGASSVPGSTAISGTPGSSPINGGVVAGNGAQLSKDVQAFTQSLLQALSAAKAAAANHTSAAGSPAIAAMQNDLQRVSADLGINASSSAALTASAAGQSPSAPMSALLQGLLKHLQQQGAVAGTMGHAVTTTA
jgi:hypothetical protein